jgi:site-specific DNA-methyltransferase (adenine-specific)
MFYASCTESLGPKMLQVSASQSIFHQLLNTIIVGDAFDLLNELPTASIDLIITSPPYWGHRDYNLKHNWNAFNNIPKVRKIGAQSEGCEWYRSEGGVLGSEPYPEWYIAHLTEILARAVNCLKPSGSMWINIGDTYFARWSSIRNNGRQGLDDVGRKTSQNTDGWFPRGEAIASHSRATCNCYAGSLLGASQ